MCLLKNIKVKCDKHNNELLCSKHKIVYKTWCEAGGYLSLLMNNIEASEVENIEFFKSVLVDLESDIEGLNLEEEIDIKFLHHIFQNPIKYYIL